jgi:formate hydrogenlyase subunit 3/multisubunit Na+/H+ antiporter MnhD subunit
VVSIFTALSSLITTCLPHKHLIRAHFFFTPWDFLMMILWTVAVALYGKWMNDYKFFSSEMASFLSSIGYLWQLDLLKTIFALGLVLMYVSLSLYHPKTKYRPTHQV